MDMLYRVARAGYPVAYEPQLLVYHQHRREHAKLRRQMWSWGSSFMAFVTKSYKNDPSGRAKIRRLIRRWFARRLGKLILCLVGMNPYPWTPDLAAAELLGGIVGLFGEYQRSLERVERIRRTYP
jgi:hypothetical protein